MASGSEGSLDAANGLCEASMQANHGICSHIDLLIGHLGNDLTPNHAMEVINLLDWRWKATAAVVHDIHHITVLYQRIIAS